jgi:hypothetical protein
MFLDAKDMLFFAANSSTLIRCIYTQLPICQFMMVVVYFGSLPQG